jgi:hypothetical protein
MIEWVVPGVLVLLLFAAVYSASRANLLIRQVKKLETDLTELGTHLGEEVAEKIALESRALREEILTRLSSLDACVDRMATIETRLTEAGEREEDAPDPEATLDALRPLIREAVETLDGRIRAVTEHLAAAPSEGAAEIVTKALVERGFSDIVVTREAVSGDGTSRLTVEAKRDGMTYKGPVLLDGTQVASVRLKPAYPMFP